MRFKIVFFHFRDILLENLTPSIFRINLNVKNYRIKHYLFIVAVRLEEVAMYKYMKKLLRRSNSIVLHITRKACHKMTCLAWCLVVSRFQAKLQASGMFDLSVSCT